MSIYVYYDFAKRETMEAGVDENGKASTYIAKVGIAQLLVSMRLQRKNAV